MRRGRHRRHWSNALRAPSHTHDWATYSIAGIVKRKCRCGDLHLDRSDDALELVSCASNLTSWRASYLLDAATTVELDRGYSV